MSPVDRLEPTLDGRARQLRLLIRLAASTAGVVALINLVAGIVVGDWRIAALGAISIPYCGWLIWVAGRLVGPGREVTIARIAIVTLGVVAVTSVLQPELAPSLAIGSILPAVLVLPFLDSRTVGRILALAGVVGLGSFAMGEIMPANERIPAAVGHGIGLVSLVTTYCFLLLFLWEVGRRLKTNADDLRSVVAMSSDLARTMDPQLVGDRIARHIAAAVGASDCALSYWDRDGDRLVTLGYFPNERRNVLQPSYPVADYPQTRIVLEQAVPAIIDVADPTADRQEVRYLRSIDQRSMAIVPLVAAGTVIGTLELTSERSGAFDGRHVEIATMLAGEAAMAFENARLYDELRHRALHDGLTGLANRVLFRDRVVQALERRRGRDSRPFAVLFIDLDDFKVLNDTLGHGRGDEVLVAVARRVADSLRAGDTAARLGGDEFAVLLDGVGDESVALSVAIRLADTLREPIDLGDITASVAASIGVALADADESADDLLRNADVAMYAAKATSRGRAELFRSTLRADVAARSDLAAQLRGAAQRGELRLDYQPIVELATGNVVALEALVRWQPAGRPLLMPNDFIDLAEETGEIVPMGRWILREACRQVRAWQIRLGLADLQVSVNLSARQFQEHDLVETIGTILEETGLAPACLSLEITESGLMQRTAGTIGRLAELRALGLHLAIDDFGTGYSSLSYLERFPVDVLKIDRSFIAGMSPSGERPAIARAIVELGRTLGLAVVAEGIEEAEQAEWLISLGCPFGQGYLYSRPLGVDGTEAFLAGNATRQVRDDAPAATATDERRRARRARPLRLVSGE